MYKLNCFNVPDTNIKLRDGDIVKLSQYPNIKWVVHKGWYSYQGEESLGWYFYSIPDGTILPFTHCDMITVTIISSSCCNCEDCFQPVPDPQNDCIQGQIDRAFITVDYIVDRDALTQRILPDGKLVRVNDVDGSPRYYQWDKGNQSWIDLGDITSSLSRTWQTYE